MIMETPTSENQTVSMLIASEHGEAICDKICVLEYPPKTSSCLRFLNTGFHIFGVLQISSVSIRLIRLSESRVSGLFPCGKAGSNMTSLVHYESMHILDASKFETHFTQVLHFNSFHCFLTWQSRCVCCLDLHPQ